jgi:hypothetical protein
VIGKCSFNNPVYIARIEIPVRIREIPHTEVIHLIRFRVMPAVQSPVARNHHYGSTGLCLAIPHPAYYGSKKKLPEDQAYSISLRVFSARSFMRADIREDEL